MKKKIGRSVLSGPDPVSKNVGSEPITNREYIIREREKKYRDRETKRQSDRETEKQRDRETETETETEQRAREKQTKRERETNKRQSEPPCFHSLYKGITVYSWKKGLIALLYRESHRKSDKDRL